MAAGVEVESQDIALCGSQAVWVKGQFPILSHINIDGRSM